MQIVPKAIDVLDWEYIMEAMPMLAVVNFPEYTEESETVEKLEDEIDALFDYMDERVEQGASATEITMAMALVLKMITETEGNLETVH